MKAICLVAVGELGVALTSFIVGTVAVIVSSRHMRRAIDEYNATVAP